MNTYSVLIRVQRVTIDYGWVNVSINSDVVSEREDGTEGLDWSKITGRAVEISHSPDVTWYVESQEIKVNPIQQPPKPGEKVTPDTTRVSYVFFPEENTENQ